MVIEFLKGLFTATPAEARSVDGDPVEYEGYTIVPAPINEGSTWRVSGRISREVDGEVRTHTFVRADTYPDRDATVETTLFKARRIIDERGAGIFDA